MTTQTLMHSLFNVGFPRLEPCVELQTIYKDQARRKRDAFARVLDKRRRLPSIDEGLIDDFVKNSHGL